MQVCNGGACASDCGDLTECDGGCVETQAHPLNCGECDHSCLAGAECQAGECACPGDAVGYAETIEPIFVDNCTAMGCHGFPMPKEGLDLRAGNGYALMVGVVANQCDGLLRVEAGNPASSYVLNKLQGVDLCFGTRMPKADPLETAEIDLIAAWICHGALP